MALREQARASYIAVCRALASAVDDPGAAALYCLRLLDRDPYDEQAYLALVSARLAARAHGEAHRAYARYVARMDEIGVEPAPFPGSERR